MQGRGAKLFQELTCAQCHGIATRAVFDARRPTAGPDLTHVGSKKNREYILESIVFPDKQIAEGFEIARHRSA